MVTTHIDLAAEVLAAGLEAGWRAKRVQIAKTGTVYMKLRYRGIGMAFRVSDHGTNKFVPTSWRMHNVVAGRKSTANVLQCAIGSLRKRRRLMDLGVLPGVGGPIVLASQAAAWAADRIRIFGHLQRRRSR